MRAVAATAARAPRAAAMAASLILVAAPAGMAPVAMVDGTALPPVTFSAEQDHRNMLEQLGIEALRPGASGDENSADPAGHRRSRGGGLRTHSWERAQGELARDRERPGDARPLSHPRFRSLVGQVDDSAYPAIHVVIPVTLVVPAAARRKVPVLIMFWFGPTPVPSTEPNDRELGHLNDALRSPLSPLGRNADGDPPSIVELIAAGWGFAVLDPTAVQADSGAGLTRGIIGLTNRGQPRTPDQWGALRAWGWAASRTLDYLETDPAVDGRDVGIEGVSRYGKAALVTMAFDRRFAMALIGSSGRGGAALLRRNYGETLENLTGSGEYHWMAGNFLKYGAAKAAFGARNPGDLSVDSHELIALCAPRLVFVSYGLPAMGDAQWVDPRGSFMAAVAASPVYQLLGARGLDVVGSYLTARMPAVNHGMLDGQLAWRQDDGGHTDAPNMKYFIAWVDRFIHYPARESLMARGSLIK